MACTQIIELLGRERNEMQKEIERDRLRLSRQQGHNIDFDEAKKHFLCNYLGPWAEKFREHYCRDICHYACHRQN